MWYKLIDSLYLVESMSMTYEIDKEKIPEVAEFLEKLGMGEGYPAWGEEKYEWRNKR